VGKGDGELPDIFGILFLLIPLYFTRRRIWRWWERGRENPQRGGVQEFGNCKDRNETSGPQRKNWIRQKKNSRFL